MNQLHSRKWTEGGTPNSFSSVGEARRPATPLLLIDRNRLLTPRVGPTHRRTHRFPCLIAGKPHRRWCWEAQPPASPRTHLRRDGSAHPPRLCFRRRNVRAQNSLGDGTVHPASAKEAFSEDVPFYHLLGTLNMHTKKRLIIAANEKWEAEWAQNKCVFYTG